MDLLGGKQRPAVVCSSGSDCADAARVHTKLSFMRILWTRLNDGMELAVRACFLALREHRVAQQRLRASAAVPGEGLCWQHGMEWNKQ